MMDEGREAEREKEKVMHGGMEGWRDVGMLEYFGSYFHIQRDDVDRGGFGFRFELGYVCVRVIA